MGGCLSNSARGLGIILGLFGTSTMDYFIWPYSLPLTLIAPSTNSLLFYSTLPFELVEGSVKWRLSLTTTPRQAVDMDLFRLKSSIALTLHTSGELQKIMSGHTENTKDRLLGNLGWEIFYADKSTCLSLRSRAA